MSDRDTLYSLAVEGRLNRREFMSRAAALGIGTALATSFAGTAFAEPKRGGTLRVALGHGSTTDSLDPATYSDNFSALAFGGALSNSLTEIDENGKVRPDLAESFEGSDDLLNWRFKLRSGLTFHSGRTVKATDVIASYRHHMGEASKSAAKGLLDGVADIKAEGDDVVVFTMKAASADFPYITSDVHFPVMPATDTGVDWQSGDRTGPFILEKWEAGVSARLKRNPTYHKAGMPYFDALEVLSIHDVSARTNALRSGEVDFIDRCDLKTLNMLERSPGIAILEVSGYGHYTLPMITTVAPFDNVDVRQALKYAVDREEIVAKVFLGHAKAGNDNPIAMGINYAVDPAPRHIYDPEKAKFHLKKAGLDTLAIDLPVPADIAGAVDAATLYREHAAKAGIAINVVNEAADGYWDNVWMKKPWSACYWSGRATCDWMFTSGYAGDAAWNDTFWKNPRFDELLLKARAERDDAQRAAMYAEMQQLVHDDGGAEVLVFNNYVSAHSDKLAHGAIANFWDLDGLKLAERWWFA